jgi:hypothetical protein
MGLFSIFGSLGLKTADFEAGMKRAESVSTKAGSNISSTFKNAIAGAFTIGAVENWGRQVLQRIQTLKDGAEQLGLSFQEVQEFENAAVEGGSSMQKAGAALEKFTMARSKAVGGNASAIAAFNELGISMEQVRNESVSNLTLWRAIGTELNGSNPSLVQRIALMQLLGKTGAQLVPVLEELRKPAPTNMIDEAQATALDEMTKKFERLKREALNKSVPGMTAAIDATTGMVGSKSGVASSLAIGPAGALAVPIAAAISERLRSMFGSEKVQAGSTGFGNLRVAEARMAEQEQMTRDMSAAAKSLEEIKALIKSERDATND